MTTNHDCEKTIAGHFLFFFARVLLDRCIGWRSLGGPPPSHDGAACQTEPMLIIDPLEMIVDLVNGI